MCITWRLGSGLNGKGSASWKTWKDKGVIMTTVTYSIPSISCGHCKMTIEREVGELLGVTDVGVSVEEKNAVICFENPGTKARIEALLVEIGFSPEKE